MITSQKKKEFRNKKFYHEGHPKLEKLIRSLVNKYKDLKKVDTKDFKADWEDTQKIKDHVQFIMKKNVKTQPLFPLQETENPVLKNIPGYTYVYHGSVYRLTSNGNIKGIDHRSNFFPDKDVNWFSLDVRSSELHAVEKAYEKTKIKTKFLSTIEENIDDDVTQTKEEEDDNRMSIKTKIDGKDREGSIVLYLPIVYVYLISNDIIDSLIDLDIDWWNEQYFSPFGFDDVVLAKMMCNDKDDEGNDVEGYRFQEDQNQIMLCGERLKLFINQRKIQFVTAKYYNPKDWNYDGKIDPNIKLSDLTGDVEKDMITIYEKISKSIKDKTNEYVKNNKYFEAIMENFIQLIQESENALLRRVVMKSNWFHDEFKNKLNEYLKNDALNDNWDVKIEPYDVAKYLYFLTKDQYDKISVKKGPFIDGPKRINITDTQLVNMKKEDIIKSFEIFKKLKKPQKEALYKYVENQDRILTIANEIATNFKDYMYLEVLDIVRPYVMDTITQLAISLHDIAYVVLSGGEAINLSFPNEIREATGDIDTKIILKNVNDYSMNLVKYMNRMWYEHLDDLINNLNKNYYLINNELNFLLKPDNQNYCIELKMLNFTPYDSEYDNKQVFTKRFTRQYTPAFQFGEDNLLFAIDMQIKSFLTYGEDFEHGPSAYSGFVDMPLIYNKNGRDHLMHYVVKYDKSRDFGKQQREKLSYDPFKIKPQRVSKVSYESKRRYPRDTKPLTYNKYRLGEYLKYRGLIPDPMIYSYVPGQQLQQQQLAQQQLQQQQLQQQLAQQQLQQQQLQQILNRYPVQQDQVEDLPAYDEVSDELTVEPIEVAKDVFIYFVSQKYTQSDVDRLLRLKMRPWKEDKDKKRKSMIDKIEKMYKLYNSINKNDINSLNAFYNSLSYDDILKYYYKNNVFKPENQIAIDMVNTNDVPVIKRHNHDLSDCEKMSCFGKWRMLYFNFTGINAFKRENIIKKIKEWYEQGLELPFEYNKMNTDLDTYTKLAMRFFEKVPASHKSWVNYENPNCQVNTKEVKNTYLATDYTNDCYDYERCATLSDCNICGPAHDLTLNLEYIKKCIELEESAFLNNTFSNFILSSIRDNLNYMVYTFGFDGDDPDFHNGTLHLINKMIFDNFKSDPALKDINREFTIDDFFELFDYYLLYLEGIQKYKMNPICQEIIDLVHEIEPNWFK